MEKQYSWYGIPPIMGHWEYTIPPCWGGRKREESCNALLVPPSTTSQFLSPPYQVVCSLNERESGKTEEGCFLIGGSGKTWQLRHMGDSGAAVNILWPLGSCRVHLFSVMHCQHRKNVLKQNSHYTSATLGDYLTPEIRRTGNPWNK